MKAWACAVCALALCAACGGDSEDGGSGGGAGVSGSSGSGGTSGSGGSTGGTAGATGGTAGSAGGSGGSTGGSAGSTGGSAGSTGGSAGAGGECASLLDAVQKTLAEAQACSPILAVIQCSGSATGFDPCACEVVLNETQPDKVKAANDAYDAWVKAGCGPFACGKACPEGTSGTCDPTTSMCRWN